MGHGTVGVGREFDACSVGADAAVRRVRARSQTPPPLCAGGKEEAGFEAGAAGETTVRAAKGV